MSPRVTLIGKPDCHLCADARQVVADVCAETGEEWAEVSIEDDPALFDEYWERIPVVQLVVRALYQRGRSRRSLIVVTYSRNRSRAWAGVAMVR